MSYWQLAHPSHFLVHDLYLYPRKGSNVKGRVRVQCSESLGIKMF